MEPQGVQLGLWPDVRVPDEFLTHFETSGQCQQCKRPLRNHAHARWHWRQCRTPRSRTATLPRLHFVWNIGPFRWQLVTPSVFRELRAAGFTVAMTYGVDLSTS